MPYIAEYERDLVDPMIPSSGGVYSFSPGILNYFLTRIIRRWIGGGGYARMNAALGVLEAVKQELYRRQIAPYEDYKCEENGDVY